MVALATNVIDEVNAEVISGHLQNLTGRHLPLAVLLRDREMFQAADLPAESAGYQDRPISDYSMFRAAAAADLLVWRHEVISNLRHRGVLMVDEFPENLTAPLINRYLEVKAKHLL
jgi:uncharacterized protein (DUF58 family)